MGGAGFDVPRVLGHENAGWVHEVGDGVTTVDARRRGARLPRLELRALRAVPARARHALRASPVHRADARRRLRRLRARRRALADQAAGGRRAERGRAARRRRHHRLPRGEEALAAPRPGQHDGDHRRRRRRATSRCSSCARSAGRIVAIDTDERRRALARELGADEVLGEQANVVDAVREATNGAGADVVIDFVAHRRDARRRARDDRARRALLDRRLRRHDHRAVGRARRRRDAIAGNLVGSWIDLWELLQLHARGAVTLRTRDASAREP